MELRHWRPEVRSGNARISGRKWALIARTLAVLGGSGLIFGEAAGFGVPGQSSGAWTDCNRDPEIPFAKIQAGSITLGQNRTAQHSERPPPRIWGGQCATSCSNYRERPGETPPGRRVEGIALLVTGLPAAGTLPTATRVYQTVFDAALAHATWISAVFLSLGSHGEVRKTLQIPTCPKFCSVRPKTSTNVDLASGAKLADAGSSGEADCGSENRRCAEVSGQSLPCASRNVALGALGAPRRC